MINKKRTTFTVHDDTIRGDLYLPDTIHSKIPAVIVAGPMTSVKEQVTGVYAKAMAEQGFAALTIDHRHYGESDGQPRQFEYYKHKIEDLTAAVEFLSLQSEVDANDIGLLGICLGCGYASWASINANKAKWLGLVVGYYRDVDAIKADDPIAFQEKVEQGIRARKHYESAGEVTMIPAAKEDGDAAMKSKNLVDYYGNQAKVPNYTNAFAIMSREHFLTFDVQLAAKKIAVPTYMVHSENALSPRFARKFYENLNVEKDQLWLTGKDQTDFYKNIDLVKKSTSFIAQQHQGC